MSDKLNSLVPSAISPAGFIRGLPVPVPILLAPVDCSAGVEIVAASGTARPALRQLVLSAQGAVNVEVQSYKALFRLRMMTMAAAGGYWPMDDAGPNAADLGAYNHPAAGAGAPAFAQPALIPGDPGTSVSFAAATADVLNAGFTPDFLFGGAMTGIVIFKANWPGGTPTDAAIISQSDGAIADCAYLLHVPIGTRYLSLALCTSDHNLYTVEDALGNVTDNVTHLAVFTYKRNGLINLYIDGAPSASLVAPDLDMWPSGQAFAVGNTPDLARPADGFTVEHALITSGEMSAADVAALYADALASGILSVLPLMTLPAWPISLDLDPLTFVGQSGGNLRLMASGATKVGAFGKAVLLP